MIEISQCDGRAWAVRGQPRILSPIRFRRHVIHRQFGFGCAQAPQFRVRRLGRD